MNRNSSRICGRNTSTEPTPVQTPSTNRERTHGFGTRLPTQAPLPVISHCTAFISGRAQEKIDWNTTTTTRQKISGPQMACRSTESSRLVQTGGAGAR